jgi:hypothetical protein
MIFCDDGDLMRVQPYVFEHGVASFEEYHEVAAGDILDALLVTWLPFQGVVGEDDFVAERLDGRQWVLAAVYRVLGWYVLPRLAASVGGEGLIAMMSHYRVEYKRELLRVISAGVMYDTGNGYVRASMLPISEQQRLRR